MRLAAGLVALASAVAVSPAREGRAALWKTLALGETEAPAAVAGLAEMVPTVEMVLALMEVAAMAKARLRWQHRYHLQ